MNAKTRILIVVSNLEYGGAQRQIVELVNNLDMSRYDVQIASLSDYVPLASQIKPAVRVHIVHKRSRFDFSVVFKLLPIVRQQRTDIVHTYLFDAEIAGRLVALFTTRRLKVIGAERNTNYEFKQIQLIAYKLTNWLCDVVIANSQSGADFNSKHLGIPPEQYRVIYNGVDSDRFCPMDRRSARSALGLGDEHKVIGVFASFKAQKNHLFLLDAVLSIRDDYPEVRLLLVGEMLYGGMHGSDDYNDRVVGRIQDTALSEICILPGNRDDVEALYPACDFTVLPSLFEGTPNVILESMSCGVPVIATRVSDNDRIVVDNETGLLVELGNTAALAAALRRMLDNPSETAEFGKRSRERIIEHFSTRRLAENTAAVYDELVAGK